MVSPRRPPPTNLSPLCQNTVKKIKILFSLSFFPHKHQQPPFERKKCNFRRFSYKTSLSSSSSPSSSATSRRPKSGLNSNKNKLLKDESNGLSYNNNNKDDMQLVSHSSYWPSQNENVKRSQVLSSSDSGGSNFDDLNVKDYLGDMPSSSQSESDGVMYDDDYDLNGFFNSVNQDNINDFYFYINQLLSSKKSNQKSI
jgi:hypothetical protein